MSRGSRRGVLRVVCMNVSFAWRPPAGMGRLSYLLRESVQEAVLGREQHGGDARADAYFVVDVLQVVTHRVLADHQVSGNFLPTQSTRQHAKDVGLTFGKARGLGGRSPV